mmetsp:Transcript_55760/g.102207  ORF Transcript_55760/g.102207 Transcript_55760/m.102207 type:complete len:208 (+) Transcript_55760:1970-2593(+)
MSMTGSAAALQLGPCCFPPVLIHVRQHVSKPTAGGRPQPPVHTMGVSGFPFATFDTAAGATAAGSTAASAAASGFLLGTFDTAAGCSAAGSTAAGAAPATTDAPGATSDAPAATPQVGPCCAPPVRKHVRQHVGNPFAAFRPQPPTHKVGAPGCVVGTAGGGGTRPQVGPCCDPPVFKHVRQHVGNPSAALRPQPPSQNCIMGIMVR